MKRKISFYIHWPFCHSICGYCDFNRFVFDKNLDREKFLKCYIKRINYFSSIVDFNLLYTIESIFFGGGTPSTMFPSEIGSIIKEIMKFFPEQNVSDVEVTIESNPISGSKDFFKEIKKIGVNRVSIGIQSFDKNKLKFLERTHSVDEAIESIKSAKSVFDRFSFDLICDSIFDRNGVWENDLTQAESLLKNHISIYSLSIEKGSKFFKKHILGEKLCLEDDESLNYYKKTESVLSKKSLKRYEISNYCSKNDFCRHNMMYWTLQDYVGIGCGAHSRFFDKNGFRFEAIEKYKPSDWAPAVLEASSQAEDVNDFKEDKSFFFKAKISIYSQIIEILMMGLRIVDGISISEIKHRLKVDIMDYINPRTLEDFVHKEMIFVSKEKLSLTKKGMFFSDYIIRKLCDINSTDAQKAKEKKVFSKPI